MPIAHPFYTCSIVIGGVAARRFRFASLLAPLPRTSEDQSGRADGSSPPAARAEHSGWVGGEQISVCGRCEFGWPGIGPDKQRSVRADWFGPSAGQAVVSGPVLERLRCGDGRLPLVSVPLLVKPRVLPRSPAACAARSCCVLQRGACPEICSFSSLLVSYSLFFPLSLSVSVSLSPFVPCSY